MLIRQKILLLLAKLSPVSDTQQEEHSGFLPTTFSQPAMQSSSKAHLKKPTASTNISSTAEKTLTFPHASKKKGTPFSSTKNPISTTKQNHSHSYRFLYPFSSHTSSQENHEPPGKAMKKQNSYNLTQETPKQEKQLSLPLPPRDRPHDRETRNHGL